MTKHVEKIKTEAQRSKDWWLNTVVDEGKGKFGKGYNFGRKGKRKNLCFSKLCTDQHDEEHDEEGQSGSDAPAENTDHSLPALNVTPGVNIKSFLEIQTNGSCGD